MRLFLYILRALSVNFLFLLMILVGIMLIIQSVRFVDLLLNRSFSLGTLVTFFSLLMPYILYFILPLVTFVTVLYTYQKFSQERELIAMRAAGLSARQISYPAVLLGIIITLFCYYNSFVLVPQTAKEFKNMQYDLKEDITATLVKENQFNELTRGLTIFMRKKISMHEYRGLLIQDDRKELRKYTYVAETGKFLPIPGGVRLILINGSQQEISPEGIRQVKFDQLIHEIELDKQEAFRKDTNTMEKSVGFLLSPTTDESQQKQVQKYIVAGHERITSPLYVLAYIFLCLTLLLQGTYQRRGDYKKLIAIVLIGFGLQAATIAIKNISYSLPPFVFLLYLIPLAIIAWGSFVLFQGKRA